MAHSQGNRSAHEAETGRDLGGGCSSDEALDEGLLHAASHSLDRPLPGLASLESPLETAPRPVGPADSHLSAAPETGASFPDIGTASFPVRRSAPRRLRAFQTGPRIPVLDTTVYPFSAICSLTITAGGDIYSGTGWFISPRTIVTAGHNLFVRSLNPSINGWVQNIRVSPGRNGVSMEPFNFVNVDRRAFICADGWINTGDPSQDYGVIHVPPMFPQVGAFGFSAFPDAGLTGLLAHISGYPANKPAGTQWIDSKPLGRPTPTQLLYNIDTSAGQSGAPIYTVLNGQPIAVGIHTNGVPDTNFGVRINPMVHRNLLTWR